MTSKHFIRKAHRYLGLVIGIQFLGWTVGGIFFSWNNLDDVHGDHLRKNPQQLQSNIEVVSPSAVLKELQLSSKIDSVRSINLIAVAGKPTYQIAYFAGHPGDGVHHHVHYALADGQSGKIRTPLSKEEAVLVAQENVIVGAKVTEVKLLEAVGPHHEFRESPLPAYAVSFSNPDCTAYVSAERGTFQTIRHDQWRAFDFLWMFHTMDYQSRDNFNNWLLKSFSVLGFVTVLSGFILFFVSSQTFRKLTQYANAK